jgi:hypothetical protein
MNKRRLTLLFFILALVAVLAVGALKARQDYLQRGIPQSLPEPIPHSNHRLGLNVYLQEADEETLNQSLADIANLGITAIKQPFYFEEPFDWETADRIISAVQDHNLQLVSLLDGNPANEFAPPSDPAVLAAWTGEFAER